MRENPDTVKLEKEQRKSAAEELRVYLEKTLDTEDEISGLQATMVVDFFSERIGKYYYNQGIADAIETMRERMDDLYLLAKEE